MDKYTYLYSVKAFTKNKKLGDDLMSISENLKEKLLKNTGFFEGEKGYSSVAGNGGDQQGMSFGII